MMYTSFYVRPSAGEQVETTVALRPDTRPALLGTAVDQSGKPVAGALAVLTLSGKTEPDRVVHVTYTDELGRFAFGPLEPGALYQVSLHADAMLRRSLEQPEE